MNLEVWGLGRVGSGVRRVFIVVFLMVAPVVRAGEGAVLKVLPQFLDKKGEHALSPSLYERDAYQHYLLVHPAQRAALRLAVEWKARNVDWSQVKLRAEMRGLTNNVTRTITIDKPLQKHGRFASWTEVRLEGDDFWNFGQLIAWRVSIWEGEHQLGQLQSFLWSGVPPDP